MGNVTYRKKSEAACASLYLYEKNKSFSTRDVCDPQNAVALEKPGADYEALRRTPSIHVEPCIHINTDRFSLMLFA